MIVPMCVCRVGRSRLALQRMLLMKYGNGKILDTFQALNVAGDFLHTLFISNTLRYVP